ncbi:MAG TPA: 6-phosphogluconolactonase [Gaiellaceae bacterium]|nr:6-phosphogluconolactonase [Gaiellaceae bacterium]
MALHELEVMRDDAAAARVTAETIADRALRAVDARGAFTVAVSGGTAPWQAFRLLGDLSVPWDAIEIFQVDERVAPSGDDDRNLTHLKESLPPDAVVRLRPMPVEADDLEAAAAEYASILPAQFDLIHLGLGPDGHTASLVPGDPVLDVTDRTVAITGEYQGRRRMTLTYPPIDGARELLWLVTGDSKVEALKQLLAGDPSVPAGRVRAARSLVIADPPAVEG